jgi:hypothetical protein
MHGVFPELVDPFKPRINFIVEYPGPNYVPLGKVLKPEYVCVL